MDATTLARFRQQLLDLQASLEGRAATSTGATATVELDQQSVGRLSRMDALQGQQMARETERRRLLQLQQVAGALKRMASGDYGLCVICDEPINPKRLGVDPTATRCITCVD